MSAAPSSDNLTLEVENFGPIVEAKIELRPLTVFTGPGNTGKSWLATLIYALHRHFESLCRAHPTFFIRRSMGRNVSAKEIDALVDWANSEIFSKRKNNKIDNEKIIDLPDFIMRNISEYFDESNEKIIDHVCRALGVENRKHLIRNSTKHHHTSISIIKNINDRRLLHQRSILKGDEFKKSIAEFSKMALIDIGDLKSVLPITEMRKNHDPNDLSSILGELLADITNKYVFSWLHPLSKSAFYFPADRAEMMRIHRTIVRAIVGNAVSADLRPRAPTAQLSGVIADFLQHLIDIDSPPYHNGRPHHTHTMERHGIEIEKNIVGGDIGIERSQLIGYPEFTYQPKGWKVPLSLINASSMVSELAPIVLFLRHKVMQGNTLIIEEPEARLHPQMQVEFTQQIATLVQSGVRVILTTHSEWVLQTLANIVCASALTEKERSKIPIANIALNQDQVGIWLFKQKRSPKGSVVEEMALDRETGLYDSDYDAVSEALYGDNTLIYNAINKN